MANQIANAGFEVSHADWEDWDGGVRNRVTTTARSGVASLEIVAAYNGSGAQYRSPTAVGIPASPDQVWELRVWAKGSGNLKIGFWPRKADFGGLDFQSVVAGALTAGWVEYTQTFTAPALTAYVTPVFMKDGAGTFHIDDAFADLFVPSSSPTLLRLGSSHVGPLRVGKVER